MSCRPSFTQGDGLRRYPLPARDDKDHGRVEERFHYECPAPADFPARDQWPDLKALGMVIRRTQRDGHESWEAQHYLLSTYPSAKRFAEAVRSHWGIENNLHGQLDVGFHEDGLRIRTGHAPANMSILTRTALPPLKNEPTCRRGICTKRLNAGWNTAYLEKVLTEA